MCVRVKVIGNISALAPHNINHNFYIQTEQYVTIW